MINNLLKNAVSTVLQDEKQQSPHPLVVVFENPELMVDFETFIAPIATNFKHYQDGLICFFPLRELTDKAACRINKVLNNFDQALLQQPFHPDWLNEYMNTKRFGVNYVEASAELTPSDKIDGYFKAINDFKKATDKNTRQIISIRDAVAHYNLSGMIESFDRLFRYNFDGANGLAKDLFAIIEQETKDQHHFSRHPALKVLTATEAKANALIETSGDISESMKALELRDKTKETFYKLTKHNEEDWGLLVNKLEQHISANYPDLTTLDLDTLLKEFTPIQGLNLNYFAIIETNQYLSEDFECIMRRWTTVKAIAETVVAYYLTILEHKQERAFEHLLVEHSKVMDQQPFYENLLRIAEESKNPQQFELEHDLESEDGFHP